MAKPDRPTGKSRKRNARTPSGIPPARGAALEALDRTLTKNMDAQAGLDSVLVKSRLTPQDRGLATELVYGTLRQWDRIEYILSTFLKDPKRLPDIIRLTMAVASHEILNLDKIPPYASVDWAVEKAKRTGRKHSGLVNAVLRKVAGLGDAVHDPAFYGSKNTPPVQRSARMHSAPEWLAELWFREYGPDQAEQLLAAQSRAPALGLRVNPGHAEAEATVKNLAVHDALLDSDKKSGFAFPAGTSSDKLGLTFPGPAVRLSFGAQQAMAALGYEDFPAPVWDCCSGRGGKTRMTAETGKIVFASDPHMGRLKALRREFREAGLPDIPVFRARADRTPPLAIAPGTILVDAPCSGLGVLSRRPDAKRKRTPADLETLAALQKRILDTVYPALKPGGLLAYLTCTLNPAENERQIEQAVRNHPGAQLELTWTTPPDSALNEFFWCALIRKK